MNPATSNILEVKKQTFPFLQVYFSCLSVKRAFKSTSPKPSLEYFAVPRHFIVFHYFKTDKQTLNLFKLVKQHLNQSNNADSHQSRIYLGPFTINKWATLCDLLYNIFLLQLKTSWKNCTSNTITHSLLSTSMALSGLKDATNLYPRYKL